MEDSVLSLESLRTFWRRDSSADVKELNALLQLKGEDQLASEVPPNPFVGNPDSLLPGECVALFGINPAYRPNLEGFQETEIEIPTRALEEWKETGKNEALQPWMEKITQYFVSDTYYGRYFTRLGNILGQQEFNQTWSESPRGKGARMVFHNHVLKLDLIPYYSAKAVFNLERLKEAYETHPALIAYRELVSDLLKKTKPKWILLNGKAPTTLMEALFASEPFVKRNNGPSPRTEISVGKVSIGSENIPVLGVKFVNSIHGPTSDEDWSSIWPTWNQWCRDQMESKKTS